MNKNKEVNKTFENNTTKTAILKSQTHIKLNKIHKLSESTNQNCTAAEMIGANLKNGDVASRANQIPRKRIFMKSLLE